MCVSHCGDEWETRKKFSVNLAADDRKKSHKTIISSTQKSEQLKDDENLFIFDWEKLR